MDDIIFSDINDYLYNKNIYSIYDQLLALEKCVEKLYKIKNSDVDLKIIWSLDHVSFIDTTKLQSINLTNLFDKKMENNKYFVSGKTMKIFDIFTNVSEIYDVTAYDQKCYNVLKSLIETDPDLYKTIKLNDTVYNSINEILLDISDTTKRFGFDANNKTYYGSTMFYVNLFILCFNNMIPACIIDNITNNNDNTYNIHKIIANIDYEELQKYVNIDNEYQLLNKYNLNPIEYALHIYKTVDDHLLKTNLTNIILFLSKYSYYRPPILYAKYLMLTELYSLLEPIKCIYEFDLTNFDFNIFKIKDTDIIKHINTFMLKNLLKDNNNSNYIEYIDYVGYNDIRYIYDIDYINDTSYKDNIKKILLNIFDKLSEYDRNNLILYFGCINVYNDKHINIKFEDSYLSEIIPVLIGTANFVSLLYILKTNHNIKNYITLSSIMKACLKSHINFIKLYKLFIKFGINIFDVCNKISLNGSNTTDLDSYTNENTGNNILHYIALNKPNLFIDIELNMFDMNMDILRKNNVGDTFLHILCRKKMTKIIEHILQTNTIDINITNFKKETLLLIAAMTKQEVLYKLLLKYKADDSLTDLFGNSVYHYICMNKMFIGSKIKLLTNKCGYTPLDYTNYKKYYEI